MNRQDDVNAGSTRSDHDSTRVLVTGDDTGGRFALIELSEERGGGPPRHLHHWEDEVVYVLAGEVTFFRGDEQLPGLPGSCVLLPRGQEHSYRVESANARLLVAVAPAGFEGSYREGAWTEDGDAVERLITVAARYGVDVTGPPPSPRERPTPSGPCGGR